MEVHQTHVEATQGRHGMRADIKRYGLSQVCTLLFKKGGNACVIYNSGIS